MKIISVSKRLSLNDSYWVADENFTGTFDQINLYENRFSQVLAYIAFTGYGSSIRSSQLRHLLTFKLRKHSRYNLSDHEITLIEKQVRKRAKLLLK